MGNIITQSMRESTVEKTPIFSYLYDFHLHPFISAIVCTLACFLGVIGFTLHGMMGSREHCASMAHLRKQKGSLKKLKRFIKITQSKKVKHFLYKQTFCRTSQRPPVRSASSSIFMLEYLGTEMLTGRT
jgi:hypothetical protein